MTKLIPLIVVIPLGSALLTVLFTWKFKKLSSLLCIIATLSLFALSILLFKTRISYSIGNWKPPIGINFVLDGLSCLMLVIVNLLSFIISIFSIKYMDKYTAKYKFYGLFLLMIAGMNGVIITGDLFNLFVF